MKKYLIIGSLLAIFVILSIKSAVTNRVIEHSLKYENVREYVHQMVFANGVRTRTFSWEMLPIPIYLDLDNADIRSKIDSTMRTIEHNVGVPLFLATNDYQQAQIFLITSQTGQERLPDFLTRFILEVLGPKWLELFQNKAPVMFDATAYPQAPAHPCFTQEFLSDPSTQYDGDDRKPTEMLIFIGGAAQIENDILNECLIEELLHAAFFLRDANLTHGQHSIFNQTSHADRARVPTPFDLCLISELLNGTFNAKEHYKMANSIYFKLSYKLPACYLRNEILKKKIHSHLYVISQRFWLCSFIHTGVADLVDTNSLIDCKIKLLILFATPSALAVSAFQIKFRPKCGY